MRITEARVLVFDTETTGIDTAVDRIVEFGAVGMGQDQSVGTLQHIYMNPGVPIPKEASDIHGITDDKVAGCDRFGANAGGLQWLFEKAEVLCGYNAASYDAAILNAEFERHGSRYRIDPARVLDPVVFVRWHLRGTQKRRLGDMCGYFGVVLDNAHTAVADSTATAALLLKMIAAGHIPDDLEKALALQACYAALQASEFERWSYWLYRDRKDGMSLRLGAGKHCGIALSKVDAGFLNWLLNKLDDLHEGARREFETELMRRAGKAPRGVRGFLRSLRR